MKKIAILTMGLLFFACGYVKVSKITTPNNIPGFTVYCENKVENCYRKATEICPKGYTILNSVPSQGPTIFANPIDRFNIMIECK